MTDTDASPTPGADAQPGPGFEATARASVTPQGDTPVKVSVVVPVYNPGRFIDPAITSLLAQTLRPGELEVILVDDGSTDDTPAKLDALAIEHPQFRVIHTPNSGWAGRPRNIGIGEARGEYIQLLDQDDSLSPDALRRLYEMGRRNEADIVIGKVASNFRPVPHHLFRRNVDACTIRDAPLISSLTPHKMFRTAFLREHRIEFPEGRRRLEDQLFMVRAYFAARTVSILADTVCYYYSRRADGGHAAWTGGTPAAYYGNLREVLEVVVANTKPGPFRTELLGRFYRTALLDRVSEPFYLARDPATQEKLFAQVHAVGRDFIDDRVHARLGTVRRLRSTLLRAGMKDETLALAQRLSGLQASATLRDLRWVDQHLQVRFDACLALDKQDQPFGVVVRGRDALLDPRLTDGIVDAPVPVSERRPWLRLQASLRHPPTGTEWPAPLTTRVELVRRTGANHETWLHPMVHAVADLDVDRIAAGRPLAAGTWELGVRVLGPGIDRSGCVRAGPVTQAPAAMVRAGAPGVHVASVDQAGTLSLIVGRPDADRLDDAAQPLPAAGDVSWTAIELPAFGEPAPDPGQLVGESAAVEVVARSRGAERRLAGRLQPSPAGATLHIDLGRDNLEVGSWQIAVRLEDGGSERPAGTLEVVDAQRSPGGPRRAGVGGAAAALTDALRLRQRARGVVRWLPIPLQEQVRRAADVLHLR